MSRPEPPAQFAVIVTHNRAEHLARCVAAIAPQVDMVLVVDNASDPPAEVPASLTNVLVVQDGEQPPNLSRLWNLGLDTIEKHKPAGWTTWDVAVLNDDAEPPAGWMTAVSTAMRELRAVAGCSVGSATSGVQLHGPASTPSVYTRLTGWAFVLRGEAHLRADERLRWWCGDDDLSAKARNSGGLVRVPGHLVPNACADQTTRGALAEQAATDMATFVEIWGQRPW